MPPVLAAQHVLWVDRPGCRSSVAALGVSWHAVTTRKALMPGAKVLSRRHAVCTSALAFSQGHLIKQHNTSCLNASVCRFTTSRTIWPAMHYEDELLPLRCPRRLHVVTTANTLNASPACLCVCYHYLWKTSWNEIIMSNKTMIVPVHIDLEFLRASGNNCLTNL
jgi:hypothetical protein